MKTKRKPQRQSSSLNNGSRKRGKPTSTRVEDKSRTRSFPIVGIGASAGGYESFSRFLEALRPDTGMAFVLIQHLDPTHESKLETLLSRITRIPVSEIKKSTLVEPNHVYIIAPNKSLVIRKGKLELSARSKVEMPPMPIDHFFRSLAEDQGHNGIGIVFSGNGSDGTLGLEAIKAADGLTFAQEPATAAFCDMPRNAINSGCVDFILAPAQITAELARIPRHPYLALVDKIPDHTIPNYPLHRIYSILRSASGVDFADYKQSTLKRRILRRMVVHRIQGMEEYVRYLQGHSDEVKALFDDMLITVTRFFRDPKTLHAMTKKVFARLVNGRRPDSPIRIWIPGCSSGEEVYSMAICLTEYLSSHRMDFPIQIFGTDINEVAVAKARTGFYRVNIAQDVSPGRLRRFFTETEGGYQINKSIRDLCVFARQNLSVDPPFSDLDLISCQNVLIYFGPDMQRQVIPIFHYALRPNGFLVLGSAESIGSFSELFHQVDRKHRIFTKIAPLVNPNVTFHSRNTSEERVMLPALPEVIPSMPSLPNIEKAADRLLLQQFTPSGVIMDSKMKVLQFRGQTGNYLEHTSGTASLNLLKMVPDELALILRTAIVKVQRENHPVQKEVLLGKGPNRRFQVLLVPFKVPPSKEQLMLVLFQPLTALEPDGRRRVKDSLSPREMKGESKAAHLREELDSTRATLQGIIEELEASNEELKSANEEIQSSNEEMQSTNEELETAKEELQSTNEELSTVNDELQHTNQEANLVNNDLNNLLASVQIPVVMVDNNLILRRFTPSAQKFFNLIPTDVGRSLNDIKANVNVPDLDERIHGVIDTLHLHECQVQDRLGHWYSLRIRPYRTKDNKIEGAVLALLDIDAMRHSLDEMSAILWEPLLALDEELKVVKANKVFYERFQLEPPQVEGKVIYQLGEGSWNSPALRNLLERVLPEKKQIRGVPFDHDFPMIGPRRWLLHARSFEENEKTITLLALQDAPNQASQE